MKKLPLILFLLLSQTLPVLAQAFFFRAGGAYAVSLGAQHIGTIIHSESGMNIIGGRLRPVGLYYAEKGIYGSFGAGSRALVSAGYFFNPRIGLELECSYLVGKHHIKSGQISVSYDQNNVITHKNESYEYIGARGFAFTPSLLFAVQPMGRFGPYLKAGPSFAWPSVSPQTQKQPFRSAPDYTLTGGMALGFRGGIGTTFMVSRGLSVFGETCFTSMKYKPKRLEGRVEIFTHIREIRLVDEISYQREEGFNPFEAKPALTDTYLMDTISFTLGMQFSFGAHKD